MFLLCSHGFPNRSGESSARGWNFFLKLALAPEPARVFPAGARHRFTQSGTAPARTPTQKRCPLFPELLYSGGHETEGTRMAVKDTADEWRDRLSPSLDDLESLAREAYAHLPGKFRKLTGDILIAVADFPTEEALDALGMESPFDLLGLFQGRAIAQKADPQTGEFPNRITLFRRPILDYWAEFEEPLGGIVTHVLIHEIGHHFGLSDADIEAIEAEAG